MYSKKSVESAIRIIFAIISIVLASGLVYIIYTYISQDIENSSIRKKYELAETELPTLPALYILNGSSGIGEDTSMNSMDNSASESTESATAISPEEVLNIYMRQPLKNYNHTGLKSVNSDYTAWIDIPGTSISYPVVQSKDNVEYLTTSFEGKQRSNGSIFIDANIMDFKNEKNLVIHGHNMKSGSMFGALSSYGTLNYYNRHPFIYLYTPEEITVYQVISAYVMPHDMDEELVYQSNFASEEEFHDFVDRLLLHSSINTNAPVSYDRNILTLSTCVNHSTSRFVVHAIKFY